jgi:hypothetical protein
MDTSEFYFEYLKTSKDDLRVLIHQEIVNHYDEDDWEPPKDKSDTSTVVRVSLSLFLSRSLLDFRPLSLADNKELIKEQQCKTERQQGPQKEKLLETEESIACLSNFISTPSQSCVVFPS